MLIPKKDRKEVYKYIFNEGVMVAKKDFNKPLHDDVPVRNLYVIKLMTSLKSRGYVRESFTWQVYYWYLTNEGTEYLRDFLHLDKEVVPQTHKKPRSSGLRRGGRRRNYGGNNNEKRNYPGNDYNPNYRKNNNERWDRSGRQRTYNRNNNEEASSNSNEEN
eukprot:TRINITY_DN18910_c0_g1_i1.p1 TRINITY_DN18910_c0_g1~~TRINITY_DN18910_c0_g1_i1.p1  ORF type:complete len:161 (-),score=48.42 TRINITY_DN18910_c0_g1_i1:156-638(-)